MPDIATRRISRDKLQAVLKTHELVKLVENLVLDVTETLPGMTEESESGLLQAPDSGAQDILAALNALAVQVDSVPGIDLSPLASAIDALAVQPVAIAEQVQALTTELSELHATVARMAIQINDLNQRAEL